MKFTDYIIVFFIIFFSFSIVTFYSINRNRESSVVNEEYANMLKVACEDTMKTANLESIKNGVWSTEPERKYAIATFYSTLAYCMNNEFTQDEANHLFIPSAVLVDTDGYYISYNSALDDKGNVYIGTSASGTEYSQWMNASDSTITSTNAYKEGVTISPINTWTETYGNFTVRFFMNDRIQIIYKEHNTAYTDEDTKVIDATLADAGTEVKRLIKEGIIKQNEIGVAAGGRTNIDDFCSLESLLYTEGKYEKERNYVAVRSINNEVEYYINYHNAYAQDHDIPYSYAMPSVSGEDWHRLLSNPTVIAFMQGRQMTTGRQFTNVYAISGGELIKTHQYFITQEGDDLVYHYLDAKNCPDYIITKETRSVTTKYQGGLIGKSEDYNQISTKEVWKITNRKTGVTTELSGYGDTLQSIYNSMEECARRGAYPCECAKNHNILD